MDQQNIRDPFVCFVAIQVIELMLFINRYQLPATRTKSLLPFQYFTDKLIHRTDLKHVFAVFKVVVPITVKWIGRPFYLDMPIGEDRL